MANTKLPARLLDTSAIPALNVTGDLTVDTTTLKVDSTNNRVGIGIASPVFPLHINSSSTDVAKFQTSGSYAYTRFQNSSKTWALSVGSDFGFYDEAASATRMVIDSSGKVGIGTDDPVTTLQINPSSGGYNLFFDRGNSTPGGANPWLGLFNATTVSAATYGWGFYDSNSDGSLQIWNRNNSTTGAAALTIKRGGNVGIGTSSPNGKFVVSNGGAEGFEVFPGSASGQNTFQHYNRSGSAYLRNRNIASEFTFNLSGASSDAVTFKAGGNVGIGTSSPNATLHVDPAPNVTTSFGSPLIKVGGDNSWAGNGSIYSIGFGYVDSSVPTKSPAEIGIVTTSNDGHTKGSLVFATRNTTGNDTPTERMRISSAGKVGIGNQNPIAKLDLGVNGVSRNTTADVSTNAYMAGGSSGGGIQYPLTLGRDDNAATGHMIGMSFDFDDGNWSSTAALVAEVEDASTAQTKLKLRTYSGGFVDGLTQHSFGGTTNNLQPGFFARGNTSQWLQGHTSSWNKLVAGIAHADGSTFGVNLTKGASGHLNGYDPGTNFNTSTGRFTAPIAGRYLIHGSIYCAKTSSNADDYMHFLPYVNGQQINQMYTMGGHKQAHPLDFSLNLSTILNLDTSDYVEWKIYTTSSYMRIYADHLCIGAHLIS